MIESFSNLFINLLRSVLVFDSLFLFVIGGLSFNIVTCLFFYLIKGKY